MEVKINQFNVPAPITFNYDELKVWVEEKAEEYTVTAYTPETIKNAKSDRASLNRLKKSLNDERIRLEKEYMKPFEGFKEQVKELIGIIDKPAQLIDKAVKEVEENEKKAKEEEIRLHFRTMEKPDWLQIEQIWNPKWLNKTVTMKAIREEMQASVEKIENDLATLAELPEFGFEASKVYESTLDMNKALNEGKRLAEIQKQKEEQERKKKESEETKKVEPVPQPPAEDFMNPPEPEEVLGAAEDVPLYPASFRAYMTEEQSQELGKWFKERNIKFEPIR